MNNLCLLRVCEGWSPCLEVRLWDDVNVKSTQTTTLLIKGSVYCCVFYRHVHTIGPDQTGGSTQKNRTRDYTGPVHFKDRLCNWTAINRTNQPVFCETGEPASSMWTGLVWRLQCYLCLSSAMCSIRGYNWKWWVFISLGVTGWQPQCDWKLAAATGVGGLASRGRVAASGRAHIGEQHCSPVGTRQASRLVAGEQDGGKRAAEPQWQRRQPLLLPSSCSSAPMLLFPFFFVSFEKVN